MGFQTLSIVASRNTSVLSTNAFDSEDLSLPLILTDYESRLLEDASESIVNILTTYNVTSNLHHDGVTPEDFYSSNLTNAFSIVSTNVDRKNKSFVSTIEHISFPFWGAQWHAERPQFEFREGTNINHTASTIKAMEFFGMKFMSEARMNNQSFSSYEEEERNLIYNFDSVYIRDTEVRLRRSTFFFFMQCVLTLMIREYSGHLSLSGTTMSTFSLVPATLTVPLIMEGDDYMMSFSFKFIRFCYHLVHLVVH